MSRRRLLLLLVVVPLLALLIVAGVLAWMATTPGGLRLAVRVAEAVGPPGLDIADPAGTLAGPLTLGRLSYVTGERSIVAEDVALQWRPRKLLERLLHVDRLEIGRLRVATRPSDEPSQPPPDLAIPLAVEVDAFQFGRAEFGGTLPEGADPAVVLDDIHGRFASDGVHHRLETLSLSTPRLDIEASAALTGRPPFPLDATARLQGAMDDRPFTVAVDADGSLRALALEAASSSGPLAIRGQALVDAFAPQPLVRGSLTATGLDPAAWVEGAPHARLQIEADFRPQSDRPDSGLVGELSAVNAEPGRLDANRLPLRRLQLQAYQTDAGIRVPEFIAQFPRGEASGTARWDGGKLSVDARIAGVDASAWHARLRETRLRGDLRIQGSGAAQQVEADLRDPRFRLALDATRRGDTVRIDAARLAADKGSLEVEGSVALAGRFDLQGRLRDFDPSALADVPGAQLNARLDAEGSFGEHPTVDLHFVLDDSSFSGYPLAGKGDVVLRPDVLAQADLNLRAGDNRLTARGGLGKAGDELIVEIDAPALAQIDLGGELQAELVLSGPLTAPAARWTAASPMLALPGNIVVRGLSSEGRWAPEGETIAAKLTARRVETGAEAPPLGDLSAEIDGRRSQHTLQASAAVGDEGAVKVVARGGLDDQQQWSGVLETLAWNGPIPVHLVGSAPIEVGPGRLVLGAATIAGTDWRANIEGLRVAPGVLESRGRFGGLPAALLLPEAAPVTSLRLGGEWNLDFGRRADGRIRIFRERGDIALETGASTVPLGLERLELVADFDPRQAEVVVHAAGTRAGTVDGRLVAALRRDGGGWGLARQAPWEGELRVDTPSIAWLSALAPENVALDGRLQATVDLGGTPSAPKAEGTVLGGDLQLRLLEHGLDLRNGSLRMSFTQAAARLERLELVSAATQRPSDRRIDFQRLTARPGRLVADGEIDLRDNSGSIRVRAEQLAVSELPDRWVMVSGIGSVGFSEKRLGLIGDLSVDAAYVELTPAGQPTLSQDVVVLGREEEAGAVPPIAIDVDVDLGEHFYFQGAGIESRLAGQLSLVAPPGGTLRAQGTVRTVEGSFDAYGRELTIERGILNFQGLIDNPGLNVRAVRKDQAVEAGVEVTGTVNDPEVRLVSVPEVPDSEKLAWMVLGRPLGQGVGAQDADLLLSAAMALRGGGQGKGPLQSLMQGLGIEELGISSGTLGDRDRFPTTHVAGSFGSDDATAAEQIATVGKRIGSNVVLSYERSLTSAESIIKLTVELTRRLSMVGRVGAINAIGLTYSFTFGGDAGG